MSIQAVAWVLDHSQSKGYARLVLIALANHHNGKTGQCNPGQRLIAREAGISPGSIPPQIRTLVDLGELEIVEEGGPRRSAHYRLPFMGAQELSVKRSAGERSARPKAERSARPWTEQNRKEPELNLVGDPPTPPNEAVLPAERAVREWCEITGTPPTRSVLRKWIPQAQEHIAVTGETPDRAFLESAHAAGIEVPAGWAFVTRSVAERDAARRADEWMEAR